MFSAAWLPPILSSMEVLCALHKHPLGLYVGWIAVESGGNLHEVTSYDERGYFQLMPEESAELGVDHQRLSLDSEYSLQAGSLLVDKHATSVRRYAQGVVDGSELFWRLVKFDHAIGPGAARRIVTDAGLDGTLQDWAALVGYCANRQEHYLAILKHDPLRWCHNVDKVYEIGLDYGFTSPDPATCGPSSDGTPNV